MTLLAHRLSTDVDDAGPRISAADRGLLLGDGVFDTMTVRGGVALDLDRHVSRLLAAAQAIAIGLKRDDVVALIDGVRDEIGDCAAIIRTTVTRGGGARGLWPAGSVRRGVPSPTILVTAQPWDERLIGQPARLVTAQMPRNQRSPLSRIKSLAYLDNILAARQAAEAGADDALFLNLDGHVACSTIGNVFVLKELVLATPPISAGCLDGVVRGRIMFEAGKIGFRTIETDLAPADILSSDAAFLTNSVRLVRPVTALDGVPIRTSTCVDTLLAWLKARPETTTAPT